MPIARAKTRRRRSRSVPLSLVPALAALVGAGCARPRPVDPCEATTYTQTACDSAVAKGGYYYSGTWYPHVYSYGALYYLTRHNSWVAGGGRVRSISPTVYAPRPAVTARPGVIRSGFGGIGAGHGVAGS